MSTEYQFILVMDYQEKQRILNRGEAAMEAIKNIMNQRKIQVLISDMGHHCGIWVLWEAKNGTHYCRQFSWDKLEPGHDGLRMQWIYDALHDLAILREEERRFDEEEHERQQTQYSE